MDEDELIDEFPDIHALFMYYNGLYFNNVLDGNTAVTWSSKRMTLCGGVCKFHPAQGFAEIRLSEPLLKLRPVRDMKMVLLHEMIHAHNMVLRVRDPDPGGHGPPFVELMDRINRSTVPDAERPSGGYRITTTHSMHAEVDVYRTHWWTCQRCGKTIKRAMNRPPQPADCITKGGTGPCRDSRCGFHTHERECGGAYTKVREPEPKKKPSTAKPRKAAAPPPLLPGQRRLGEVFGSAAGAAAKRPAAGAADADGATATDGPVAKAPRPAQGNPSASGAAVGRGSAGPAGPSSGTPGVHHAARGAPSTDPASQRAAASARTGVPHAADDAAAEPSMEDRRRQCAEAALARLGATAAPPPPPPPPKTTTAAAASGSTQDGAGSSAPSRSGAPNSAAPRVGGGAGASTSAVAHARGGGAGSRPSCGVVDVDVVDLAGSSDDDGTAATDDDDDDVVIVC